MKINNESSMSNGNVNSGRDSVNKNVSRYSIMGKSKRKAWDEKRSFRSF